MTLPAAPAAFVAHVEAALAARDPDAVLSVYAPDALVEIDNTPHRGDEAIARAWSLRVADHATRNVRETKTLASASGDTIVAEWRQLVGGELESKGVEYFRFDPEGRVYEHRVYGHAHAEPPESPRQRLRTAMAPFTAALRRKR